MRDSDGETKKLDGLVSHEWVFGLPVQGRRKVPRSGAAIILYRGRAAADNFSSALSAKIFFDLSIFHLRRNSSHSISLL